MPIDLNALAGKLAAKGGGLLAQMIAGSVPGIGPVVGPIAGDIVKNALGGVFGVPPTEDAIAAAIDRTPPGELAAKFQAAADEAKSRYEAAARVGEADAKARADILTQEARSQADVAKTNSEATATVMIAEAQANAAAPDRWWGKWRNLNAVEFTVECPIWAALIMYSIVFGDKEVSADLMASQALIQAYWLLRGSLLGVHLWQGSNERQAAITGQPVTGVVESIASRIKAPAAAPKMFR